MFPSKRTRITSGLVAAVFLVLLGVMTIGPFPSLPAFADHNGLYVVCPSALPEGDSGLMRISRPDYWLYHAFVFTYDGSANRQDYVPYSGVRIESNGDSRSLWVPVVTKEDSRSEHDETFKVGAWYEGLWHGCEITILDDDTPQITDVEITSLPVEEDTYRAGESIDVTVTTDREVEVEGRPLLSLFFNDEGTDPWRGAEYYQGSGTRYLTFRYQVHPADRDYNGLSVGAAAVSNDGTPAYGFGGQIFAKGTDVPIDYTHPGIKNGEDHKVDGRPYVQDIGITSSLPPGQEAYRANQTIEISVYFNIEVEVEGQPSQGLYVGFDATNWAESSRNAEYLRGSGTDTLVFGYMVQPGDLDERGVKTGFGNPANGIARRGSVKAKGTDIHMNPYYPGTGHLPDHRVDAVPPGVHSIGIRSEPNNGESYITGETIRVEVVFTEEVTTSGDPQLALDIGGTTGMAGLATGNTGDRTFVDEMVFQYQVQEGDTDTDGIGIDANSLRLNGGGIHDRAGNAAGLSHDAISADPNQKVDASPDY